MTGFAFYVVGTPGPQGSKRFVGRGGGRGVMVESSAKVAPWREAVKTAAPALERPLDGPLSVKLVFTLPRPKSARKADTWPCRTPDLSKLARSTEDAVTEAGLWADDARVAVYERLAKVWAGYDPDALPVPGCVIAVEEMGTGTWYRADLHTAYNWARREACQRIRGETEPLVEQAGWGGTS